MRTKHLVTISLLLPLMAVSATAWAGATISDKRYWPSEAGQTLPARTAGAPSQARSAFAYDRNETRLQPAIGPGETASAWRYHGGPKFQ